MVSMSMSILEIHIKIWQIWFLTTFEASVRVTPSDGEAPSDTLTIFSCFTGEAPLLVLREKHHFYLNSSYSHVLLSIS